MKRVVVFLVIVAVGCGRPAGPAAKSTSISVGPTLDVDTIRDDLRKPFAEPEQLRGVLEQLNATAEKRPNASSLTCARRAQATQKDN